MEKSPAKILPLRYQHFGKKEVSFMEGNELKHKFKCFQVFITCYFSAVYKNAIKNDNKKQNEINLGFL